MSKPMQKLREKLEYDVDRGFVQTGIDDFLDGLGKILLDSLPEMKGQWAGQIDQWLKEHPQVASQLNHGSRRIVAINRMYGHNDCVREVSEIIVKTLQEGK